MYKYRIINIENGRYILQRKFIFFKWKTINNGYSYESIISDFIEQSGLLKIPPIFRIDPIELLKENK